MGSVTGRPFELWREADMLRLKFGDEARIGIHEIKEVLRLLDALDPGRCTPILFDQGALVHVIPEARDYVRRACRGPGRTVAFLAHDLADRIQGNFFSRFHKPRFGFKVFAFRNEAERWIRQRQQAVALGLQR